MTYRNDEDLEILSIAENDDLQVLVDYLTRDEDGDLRLTEELTSTSGYKNNRNNPNAYWQDIAAELQCFGGNTFVNFLRGGEGVTYREVLCDVCDYLNVNYNSDASISVIEMNLLCKILIKALDEMDDDQMKELIDNLDIKVNHFTKQAVIAALQMMILKTGFSPYKISVIVANAVARTLLGRGISVAGNAALTKAISVFAGPVGIALNALWLAIDIAGPAYRVTVPAVIQVAYIRAKYNSY
ncbi:DUF3944 domain-containing protein [Selenomonas ruminantium]|uniref:Uncharacterized protein YaaW, UPF0174 family n=1 Tax=Selenomonas ruminantium TaxID=971 RepID=A0A1H0NIM0_SELRU|nr:DUF3944 domain-containing protein [Selenomonas ruminantium]SDO92617.1 Uncharacterized protein YaaW, UPF0174 family [Selenomonas ruminantium]